jgi:hypothetical protein
MSSPSRWRPTPPSSPDTCAGSACRSERRIGGQRIGEFRFGSGLRVTASLGTEAERVRFPPVLLRWVLR